MKDLNTFIEEAVDGIIPFETFQKRFETYKKYIRIDALDRCKNNVRIFEFIYKHLEISDYDFRTPEQFEAIHKRLPTQSEAIEAVEKICEDGVSFSDLKYLDGWLKIVDNEAERVLTEILKNGFRTFRLETICWFTERIGKSLAYKPTLRDFDEMYTTKRFIVEVHKYITENPEEKNRLLSDTGFTDNKDILEFIEELKK